jgi:anti-sigma-K factor RskA
MLRIDASGRAALRVEAADARRVAGFRVTLEPEGGVPAPTGDTVLSSR